MRKIAVSVVLVEPANLFRGRSFREREDEADIGHRVDGVLADGCDSCQIHHAEFRVGSSPQDQLTGFCDAPREFAPINALKSAASAE